MNHIKAIGFDLFNTLITVDPHALGEAVSRLTKSLRQDDLNVQHDSFKEAHRQAARRFIEGTRRDGRETHNRFWISAALEQQGYDVLPDDPRIAKAVEAYFSAFLEFCHLIPGTQEMLGILRPHYRLGLLSNFTHAPAAKSILELLELTPFFDVVLISGEIGYRKPHPSVFGKLVEELRVKTDEVIYVGDDPEPDIAGALRAGLQPVWTTYVRDRNIPFAPGVASEQIEGPDGDVPRISTWSELLLLLDKGS
jgi:putative hydrolase of the HAD superfamily